MESMFEAFFRDNAMLLVFIAAWTLPWKGVALWRAAGRREKAWFVVLLLVNTLAILEIIYIFVVSKKTNHDGVWQR